jgi:hypothetical protein
MYGTTNREPGLISAAVLVSLLELLVDKNYLTRIEVRAVLYDAGRTLGGESAEPCKRAAEIITKELLPLFGEQGAEKSPG